MVECDGPVGSAREELEGGVDFCFVGVVGAGVEFGGCDGEEGCVGDEAGGCWV